MCASYSTLVYVSRLSRILSGFMTSSWGNTTWNSHLQPKHQILNLTWGDILLCSQAIYKMWMTSKYSILFLRSTFKFQVVFCDHLILAILILKDTPLPRASNCKPSCFSRWMWWEKLLGVNDVRVRAINGVVSKNSDSQGKESIISSSEYFFLKQRRRTFRMFVTLFYEELSSSHLTAIKVLGGSYCKSPSYL